MRRSLYSVIVRSLLACALLFTLTACGETAEPVSVAADDSRCIENFDPGTDYFPDKVSFAHAGSVEVEYHKSYKVVTVRPAANEGEVAPSRFVLVRCGAPAPELEGELAEVKPLAVPVDRVVSLTTTNLPHFVLLDAVDTLAGVGTPGFVSSPEVIAHLEANDAGGFADANGQPELEKLVAQSPELVIMDAFGADAAAEVSGFSAAGLYLALNADFNEQSLLGRAEWLKFTALFLNAEAAANEAFAEIERDYQAALDAVPADAPRPEVFVNTPWEGTWFAPGGGAYLANAIREAGGEYVLADDDSTFSLQLDVETVLARAKDADVWLQAGSVNGTLADLAAIDERFTQFKAFREGAVWAYDKWTSPGGGNAVFEIAYARPDLFLSDLVRILHPDALPEHDTVFFGQVPAAQPAS